MSVQFTGHGGAADHRTTGERAWCHGCTEWCYPHEPCGQIRCCAETVGDSAVEQLRAERDAAYRRERQWEDADCGHRDPESVDLWRGEPCPTCAEAVAERGGEP